MAAGNTSSSDYDNIVRHCLKNETLWEDPEFPAVQSSVFYHQTPPFAFQWKRPHVRIIITIYNLLKSISLPRNKRFLLTFLSRQNASKFAIFLQ